MNTIKNEQSLKTDIPESPTSSVPPVPTDIPEKKKSNKTCCLVGCLVFFIVGIIFILVLFPMIRFLLSEQPFLSPFWYQSYQQEDTTELEEEVIPMSQTELTDYFVATTTVYPGLEEYDWQLSKWQKSLVTVSVSDSTNTEAIQAVDDFVTFFNTYSTEVTLNRIEDPKADIVIDLSNDVIDSAGNAGISRGDNCEIEQATVNISELLDTVAEIDPEQINLRLIIAHELKHSLGFVGHYDVDECVLMRSRVCLLDPYNVNEQKTIELMYGSNAVPSCLIKEEVRKFLTSGL